MWIKCNSVKCNAYRIKMRYSIEPRERKHVKEYGFLSFARNIGTHAAKVAKNRVMNIVKNLLIQQKKSAKKICNRYDNDWFKESNSKNS